MTMSFDICSLLNIWRIVFASSVDAFQLHHPQESDTFPKTNSSSLKKKALYPHKNDAESSSKHQFSGALNVSFREGSLSEKRTPGHLCDPPTTTWCNLRSPNPKTFRVSWHRWHLGERSPKLTVRGIIHTKPFDQPVDGTQAETPIKKVRLNHLQIRHVSYTHVFQSLKQKVNVMSF